MRDGRRNRLGLQEGGGADASQPDFLNRILTDTEVAESAAGPFDYLNLDPDANVNVRDQRYVNDAYQYYLGGGTGDFADEVALTGGETIPGAVDTLVDVDGGEGQATSGLGLGDTTPANTDFEQNLLDQGIGVQGAIGDPVVAPGEIPVTQQVMDEYNAPAILDSESTADEISQDLSNQQAMLNPTGGNIIDEVALTGGFSELDDLEADPGAQTFQTVSEVEANDPNFRYRDQFMEDLRSIPQDIKDRFNEIKESPLGQGVGNFKDYLMDKGGRQIADNVIKIGNTTIDIAQSLKSGAISLIGSALTGIPGLGLIAGLLPEGGRSDMSDALGGQYGMDDIGRLTGGPMAGYAVDSGFGKGIEQTTIDRINSIKNRTIAQTPASIEKIKELEGFLEQINKNNLAINYNIEGTDEGDRVDEERDTSIDTGIQTADDDSGSEMLDDAPTGVDAGTADIQDYADIYEPPAPSYSPPSYNYGGGGGGGGGGAAPGTGSSGPPGRNYNKGGIVSLKNAKK